MFLLLAVDVSLGLVGGSAAEDAHGSQGDVKIHLGPHDDYLGATIVRVADSVLVGGRVGLSGTSRDVVGDDGVAGGKKVSYFCCILLSFWLVCLIGGAVVVVMRLCIDRFFLSLSLRPWWLWSSWWAWVPYG